MPLIWASLTTSHRLVEKPARRRWREKRDGSADIKVERRKEGRRGSEEGRRREGFPQLVASILLRAEPRFIKRASKIKLRIDVASKHPAPACASLTLPPSLPPLRSAALMSIGSYCTSRASWQRPIVFAPFTPRIIAPSSSTCPPSLQPQNRAWVWSMVIVIPKTNWPSFNSTDKCKKLRPHKSQDVCEVCVWGYYTT